MMKYLLPLLLLLAGCGESSDDGVPAADRQAASRLDQIAQASGGDWTKLSDADRQFLVNEVAQGSEASAKMILQGKAGKLRATPGAQPTKGGG